MIARIDPTEECAEALTWLGTWADAYRTCPRLHFSSRFRTPYGGVGHVLWNDFADTIRELNRDPRDYVIHGRTQIYGVRAIPTYDQFFLCATRSSEEPVAATSSVADCQSCDMMLSTAEHLLLRDHSIRHEVGPDRLLWLAESLGL